MQWKPTKKNKSEKSEGEKSEGEKSEGGKTEAREETKHNQPQPTDSHKTDIPKECNAVYLSNLNKKITDAKIREIFGDCGTIEDIRWVEKESVFQGSVFVQYVEGSATHKAKALSGKEIMGRPVVVEYAISKTTKTITFEDKKVFTIYWPLKINFVLNIKFKSSHSFPFFELGHLCLSLLM